MIQAKIDPAATYARTQPHRLACVDLESGRRWTWREFDAAVGRTAGWLVGKLGPASGERIATLTRNSAEMMILQLAAARAGAVFVPFNWRLAPAELAYLAADAGSAILFHDPDFADTAAGMEARERIEMDERGEALVAVTADAPANAPPQARRGWEEAATLLYTSGTSGRPKGVIMTEANCFFGCCNFIFGNGVSRDSVFLCDMPLFHTAGLYAAARVPLQAGGTLLISKGFDPVKTLQRLADPALGVTHYFSVPQMAQRLWQEPSFEPERLRKLEIWAVGGAPTPPALVERFAKERIPLSSGFGMSETGSNFGTPMDDWDRVIDKATASGLPYLTVETRVVDEEGRDAPVGETGELWLKGPSVSPGYWNRPEENAKAFVDGWFRTGDAAFRDADGFYHLIDRKKDMFISGGENVYPAEVEAALIELESVAEAAVVGVPDERWGEVGRAYVIPRAGHGISVEALREHCLNRLAKFKVPASFVITDDIVRTASGKVQKHLLRDRALREMEEEANA